MSFRSRPVVDLPKPVPVTVTRVPPSLPAEFGETETKFCGKVKDVRVFHPAE